VNQGGVGLACVWIVTSVGLDAKWVGFLVRGGLCACYDLCYGGYLLVSVSGGSWGRC
jgi:hypothetical protein